MLAGNFVCQFLVDIGLLGQVLDLDHRGQQVLDILSFKTLVCQEAIFHELCFRPKLLKNDFLQSFVLLEDLVDVFVECRSLLVDELVKAGKFDIHVFIVIHHAHEDVIFSSMNRKHMSKHLGHEHGVLRHQLLQPDDSILNCTSRLTFVLLLLEKDKCISNLGVQAIAVLLCCFQLSQLVLVDVDVRGGSFVADFFQRFHSALGVRNVHLQE